MQMSEIRVAGMAAGTDGAQPCPPKKPVLVKLGKSSRAEIDELKNHGGALMDKIEGIVQRLEAEGRIDDDAQIVIAMVR